MFSCPCLTKGVVWVDYLYDGTYEGLLCCVYAHYYVEKATGIFREGEYQTNMFGNVYRVKTNEDQAHRVYEAIGTKLGEFTLRRSYLAYLSCFSDKEMRLLRYLVLGFRTGQGFNNLHGHPDVFGVQEMEKRIYNERHRYFGILRFSVISAHGNSTGEPLRQVLYAAIEPDNDLLELLVEHFLDRYRSDPFIIHDVGREKAVFADDGQWYVAPLSAGITTELAQGEEFYRAMWKRYFDAIAIRERTNPRCQKNFMPMKYWDHLTEKLL